MTLRPLPPLVLLLAAACAPTAADNARLARADAVSAQGLERELAGLVPLGETACINPERGAGQWKSFGATAVYSVGRGLKYRTDTTGGCEAQGRGDILVTRTTSSKLCQGDIATTINPVSKTLTGSCAFGRFTRYGTPSGG